MDESYSPSKNSSQNIPEHEISLVSLRSISSQKSVSSVASFPTETNLKRKHKVTGAKSSLSRKGKLSSVFRSMQSKTKKQGSTPIATESSQPEDSLRELDAETEGTVSTDFDQVRILITFLSNSTTYHGFYGF